MWGYFKAIRPFVTSNEVAISGSLKMGDGHAFECFFFVNMAIWHCRRWDLEVPCVQTDPFHSHFLLGVPGSEFSTLW